MRTVCSSRSRCARMPTLCTGCLTPSGHWHGCRARTTPRSDRSNLGELLDGKLVAPAPGGVPRGERLGGDVVCAVAEIGGVVWQQQVELRGIARGSILVPVSARSRSV